MAKKAREDILMANTVQSVALSQTDRSSFSTPSQPVSGSQHGHSRVQRHRRWPIADRGPEEFEYHFHKTPLGLFESYFAGSQQHHCTFASRNNPGRILSKSPEPPEPDSSDDDDATTVDRDNAVISTGVKGEKRVRFGGVDQIEAPTIISIASDNDDAHDETDDKANASERLTTETPESTNISENSAEDDVDDSAEEVIESNKPPYIPDDDLFKDRWFPDPWDRPPGQMWTKAIQCQHSLRAAIRQRGLRGPRAGWLFNELHKRKGYRFPYKERSSLKKPDQTQIEYVAALKRRKEEAQSRENQVKEYDEEGALEEVKWALDVYDKVYGPGWPHDAVKTNPSTSNVAVNRDDIDDEYEEEESSPNRRRTRQHTSTPEPFSGKRVSAVINGISDPGPGQRASLQEIEKLNRDFKSHKADVTEVARMERDEVEIKDFMRSVENRWFSNGYKESWK